MATAKKIPQRQCIGCHANKNKKDLIRILKKEDGTITIDTTGKMNGRGAYLCPNRECLEKAIKSRGLERSFKMPIPQETYDALIKELSEIDEG